MQRSGPSSAEEEYLKTILLLTESRKPVKTTDIARALSISPASVTEMLEKLAAEARMTPAKFKEVFSSAVTLDA